MRQSDNSSNHSNTSENYDPISYHNYIGYERTVHRTIAPVDPPNPPVFNLNLDYEVPIRGNVRLPGDVADSEKKRKYGFHRVVASLCSPVHNKSKTTTGTSETTNPENQWPRGFRITFCLLHFGTGFTASIVLYLFLFLNFDYVEDDYLNVVMMSFQYGTFIGVNIVPFIGYCIRSLKTVDVGYWLLVGNLLFDVLNTFPVENKETFPIQYDRASDMQTFVNYGLPVNLVGFLLLCLLQMVNFPKVYYRRALEMDFRYFEQICCLQHFLSNTKQVDAVLIWLMNAVVSPLCVIRLCLFANLLWPTYLTIFTCSLFLFTVPLYLRHQILVFVGASIVMFILLVNYSAMIWTPPESTLDLFMYKLIAFCQEVMILLMLRRIRNRDLFLFRILCIKPRVSNHLTISSGSQESHPTDDDNSSGSHESQPTDDDNSSGSLESQPRDDDGHVEYL